MRCERCQREFKINPPPNGEWLFTRLAERLLLPLDEVKCGSRRRHIVMRLQAIALHMRDMGLSYPEIGRAIGRNHTTVLHGVRKARQLLKSGNDNGMAHLMEALAKEKRSAA